MKNKVNSYVTMVRLRISEKVRDVITTMTYVVINFGNFIVYLSLADKTVTIVEPCPTKTSVLALAVTCALLVLVYISTLFCYYMKQWLSPKKLVA